jgi:hypothetical protein
MSILAEIRVKRRIATHARFTDNVVRVIPNDKFETNNPAKELRAMAAFGASRPFKLTHD